MSTLFPGQRDRSSVAEFGVSSNWRTMNPIEIIGEICTVESAFIRGWRWLFSPSYRQEVRTRCKEINPLFFAVGVFEVLILMVAEIVAVVYLVRWMVTL